MARRKRKHIPLTERLAAALACLLHYEQRKELRAAKVPAREIIRMFSFDHIALHAWEGSDRWFNLHPMLRAEHVVKSRQDTTRAAKVVRLEDKWREFQNAVGKGRKPRRRLSRWPQRRLKT